MSDKIQVIFQTSVEFKEAIGVFAQRNNVPSSELMRMAIAAYIGYDLTKDSVAQGRPKKYATKEERNKANNEKAKTKRALADAILEDYNHEVHAGAVKSLREYLIKRGVNPDED